VSYSAWRQLWRRTFEVALFAATGGCLTFHQGAMPGEPKDATFAELNDTRVRYVDVGQGPAVVMLHGFASSLETWAPVIPEVKKNHRVLALDLKGFGWTDRPEGDYSPKAQAELVLALMKQRGISKAAFVAHSWGSSVALQLAIDHPDAVERLALYDAWVYASQLPATFHFARAQGVGELLYAWFYKERPDEKLSFAFYDQNNISEELVEAVERSLERPGTTAAALAAVRGQRYEEIERRYGEVKQPTLLLWGREDRVTTLGVGERLSKQLPNARLVVYPQCGHFPMLEAPAASTAELVRFLEERP
jgi:pimeloyl-ACP methyl ester carboxylesterase